MNYYGNISEANVYFNSKLYRDLWFTTDPDLQIKALCDATERIDRLNFAGNKSDDNQALQFPRNGSADVPTNIKRATFELAFQLLDGRDPELEYTLLRRVSTGIGPGRNVNDTNIVPKHIVNGIPSTLAWSYIKPFLRDRNSIALKRS